MTTFHKSIVFIGDSPPNIDSIDKTLTLNPISEVIVVGDTRGLEKYPADRFINASSLGQALNSCSGQHVFIVDKHVDAGLVTRFFSSNQLDEQAVQVQFQSFRINFRRLKSILLLIFRWLASFAMRTKKLEICPGICQIPVTCLEKVSRLDPDQQPIDLTNRLSNGQSSLATTQLLALLKQQRVPINEVAEFSNSFQPSVRTKHILKSFRSVFRFWWNSIMFPTWRVPQEKPLKKKSKTTALAALALLTALLVFGRLDYPLFEPDEARNAELASTIVLSGDWLSLQFEGEHYWDKPPLQFWSIAASYLTFGQSPWATRLPIALSAFLTVMLTALLSQRLVGKRAAIIAGFALLASLGFSVVSRYATLDSSLTLFTTIMLLIGFRAVTSSRSPIPAARQRRKWRRYSVVTGIACGLGLMTKGPVILAIGLPPLILAAWLFQGPQSMLRKQFWKLQFPCFLAPVVLLTLPWFGATLVCHPEFAEYFFWKHHVVRFTDAFNHQEPFWYYLVGIFIFMFPASYLLPATFKFFSSRQPEVCAQRTRESGFLVLATVWIIAFFSASQAKLPTYIMPAFPLISLLIGFVLNRELELSSDKSLCSAKPRRLERLSNRMPIDLICWCVACLLALWLLAPSVSTEMVLLGLLALPVFGFALIASISIRKTKTSLAAFGAGSLLFILIGIQFVLPAIAEKRSILSATKRIVSQEEFTTAPVVFYGRDSSIAQQELPDRDIRKFHHDEIGAISRFLKQHAHSVLIASEKDFRLVRSVLPWSTEIVKHDEGRHIYLVRPNASVLARQTNEMNWR